MGVYSRLSRPIANRVCLNVLRRKRPIMDTPILRGWKEIAAFLKVHEQTAMKYANNEGLPVVKIDGNVFSTTIMIRRWILENIKRTNEE